MQGIARIVGLPSNWEYHKRCYYYSLGYRRGGDPRREEGNRLVRDGCYPRFHVVTHLFLRRPVSAYSLMRGDSFRPRQDCLLFKYQNIRSIDVVLLLCNNFLSHYVLRRRMQKEPIARIM